MKKNNEVSAITVRIMSLPGVSQVVMRKGCMCMNVCACACAHVCLFQCAPYFLELGGEGSHLYFFYDSSLSSKFVICALCYISQCR